METWIAVAIFGSIAILGVQLLRVIRKEYTTTQSRKELPLAVITLLVILGGGIVVYDILTLSTDTLTIPTSGIVPQEVGNVEMELYWDIFSQKPVVEVDWGELELPARVNVTFYVRNTGGDYFTSNFTTTGWVLNGSNSGADPVDYFTLSWTFGESSLGPDRQRKVMLTLEVADTLTGVDTFSFDIVITAWEA